MLLVCYSTFSWSSLRLAGRIPKMDLVCITVVSVVTVFRDLAQAVGIGTILSALSFAWKQSTKITAKVQEGGDSCPLERRECYEANWRTYYVEGPLFFGSTQKFGTLFDVKEDPEEVVIDFMESRVMDHSALEAINTLAERYGAAGKRVHLRHLSSDCAGLLRRLNGEANPYEIIETDPSTDPVYEVAEDSRLYAQIAPPKLPTKPSARAYEPAQDIY